MRWLLLIRPEAEADLIAARDWYDGKGAGLGDRFLDSVADAMREVEENPARSPLYYQNFRRVLLQSFPYKIFFQVIEQRVIVFRVLHVRQCHERGLFK